LGWSIEDLADSIEDRALPRRPARPQARGWTDEVVVFSSVAIAGEGWRELEAAGIDIETSPVTRLIARDDRLAAVELSEGRRVPCDVLFAHPPQRQVELVGGLGVALDDDGYVRVDPMTGETSVPGMYAAGDLTTRMQAAIVGASSGMRVAAMINLELAMERAGS
jgi:thioredoxin reductase